MPIPLGLAVKLLFEWFVFVVQGAVLCRTGPSQGLRRFPPRTTGAHISKSAFDASQISDFACHEMQAESSQWLPWANMTGVICVCDIVELMNRKLVIIGLVVALVGSLGLMAALHHVVVLTTRGSAFSNAFSGTCGACHGQKYSGFGKRTLD